MFTYAHYYKTNAADSHGTWYIYAVFFTLVGLADVLNLT
jgi:hypothetical protein